MVLALADTNGAYMQTPSLEPLLDEADFLAELVNLDHGLAVTRRTPAPPVERQAFDPFPGLPVPVAATSEPERHMATDAPPSIVWRMTAAAMFVLMMAIGAAGAAAVFHDRFARILSAW